MHQLSGSRARVKVLPDPADFAKTKRRTQYGSSGPIAICFMVATLAIFLLTFLIVQKNAQISQLSSQLASATSPPLQDGVRYRLLSQHPTPSATGLANDYLVVLVVPLTSHTNRPVMQIVPHDLYQADSSLPVHYAKFYTQMINGKTCRVLHAHPGHLFAEDLPQKYSLN